MDSRSDIYAKKNGLHVTAGREGREFQCPQEMGLKRFPRILITGDCVC